jgi:hypothetical protein
VAKIATFVLPRRAHGVDQLVEIGDELLDRHRSIEGSCGRTIVGAALVPIDDGEGPLERRVECRKKTVSLNPGPPCNRINGGLATLSPRIITH